MGEGIGRMTNRLMAYIGWGNHLNDNIMNEDNEFWSYRGEQDGPDYLPEYTHPVEPPKGFSTDWASKETISLLDSPEVKASRGAGPSKPREQAQTKAVCAGCHSPLTLNGNDEEGSKLYGLRCGHLIDAKCLEILAKPKIQDLPSEESPIDRKGKGKAKSTYYEQATRVPMEINQEDAAGANDGEITSEEEEDHHPRTRGYLAQQQSLTLTAESSSQMNSPPSRSRGRGRRYAGRGGSGRSRTRGANLRKGITTGKKKGKRKKPQVTAVHEWHCPVAGCEMRHMSVQWDGVEEWKQEPESGAIGLYV